ncbi:MAG: NAD(P) transhydrogenase subunit alpha [Thermoplasmata archaeon]|nr:NAD(P) transhydrogenase subunit alpha [Thermoplasmata archaeon]
MGVRLTVLRESAPLERRVAMVPEVAERLSKAGFTLLVERGAGERAGYPDADYERAGAKLCTGPMELFDTSIVVGIGPPSPESVRSMRAGTVTISLLFPGRRIELVRSMQEARLRVFALELLPRISRSQSMDVLSSQASLAGYEAAILGAELSPRLFPMLTTAAGTIRPSTVLILGAGVAGLMAIATARRLGAVVEGYDVRRAAGEQVRSLGAKFLELSLNAEGTGGYARELTPEEKVQESQMVGDAVARADVVITTANVPGRKAPMLVGRDVVARMKPGSVLIDLAAESGGNCELTRPGETVVVGGVSIVGPIDLPSRVAFHASLMFAKNVQAFLSLLVDPAGRLVETYTDEILTASLVLKDGDVVHAPTRELLGAPR